MRSRHLIGFTLIAMYEGAIVAANQIITHYAGAAPDDRLLAVALVGFGLIGFDLVARDGLQDLWGDRRWPMLLLIASGSLLSYAVNSDSGRIALWSGLAFLSAGLADWLVYTVLKHYDIPWLERVNSSNMVSAAVDSVVFIRGGIGAWLWLLIVVQWFAKVAGGYAWSLILGYTMKRRTATA